MRENLAWAIRLAWSSSRTLTLINAAITLLQSFTPLLGLYLLKLVVDAVAATLTTVDGAPESPNLAVLILLSAGVIVLDRLLGTASELVRGAQAQIVTDEVFSIVHRKSIDVDIEYYERPDCQDTLHRAQQEAPHRPTRIFNAIFRALQGVLSLVFITGLMVTFHWAVPLVLVAAGLPSLFVRFRFARKLYVQARDQTPDERRAAYFNAILTGDMHAKEIRLFGLGELFARRFAALRDAIRARRIDLLKKRSLADLLAQGAGALPVFALYWFVAYRAMQGLLTVGDLVMFYQAIQRGQQYLLQLFGSVAEIYENQLFLASMQEFLALEPRIKDPPAPKAPPKPLRQGIGFHAVRFQYSGSDTEVLKNVNLQIRTGEHIALVGENGCGKTTLVKLLCRLYDPTNGCITLDGIDIREFPVAALRQRVGVIFQDYNKYNLSARDNIWFGNVRLPPDADVERAAKMAGADRRIERFARRYDTLLGRKYESGEELSIGEWQKIALARAFFRESDIVILDEPSSALDAKAELEVFEKFHDLFHERTAILISHRLSTVRMADRIYFLENGAVIEAGSHAELIDQGGKYASMFEAQAQSYR